MNYYSSKGIIFRKSRKQIGSKTGNFVRSNFHLLHQKSTMRKAFMIEFDLPQVFTEEFMALIPKQRYVLNELMSRGDVQSYSLALDRSRLWMIAVGETEFEIMELIEQLPLSIFMTPDISELMFHNTASLSLEFSLN